MWLSFVFCHKMKISHFQCYIAHWTILNEHCVSYISVLILSGVVLGVRTNFQGYHRSTISFSLAIWFRVGLVQNNNCNESLPMTKDVIVQIKKLLVLTSGFSVKISSPKRITFFYDYNQKPWSKSLKELSSFLYPILYLFAFEKSINCKNKRIFIISLLVY